MNRLKYFLVSLGILSCIGACDDLFDDELPPYKLVGENAITDETSAEGALLGIYSYLDQFGIWDSYYIVDNDLRLGFLEGSYRTVFEEQLRKLEVQQSVLDLRTVWVSCAQMVNAANNFIYYVERLPKDKFGDGKQKEMLGEAKFMRAFAQLRLLKMFGHFWDINSEFGVLMRREPSMLSNNQMARSTVRETYRLILEDLDAAIKDAPDFFSVFRACKVSAKAFKAEVLMMRGEEQDYEDAKQLATEVLKSTEFRMEEDFKSIFENGYKSSELLFSRSLGSKSLVQAETNVPSMVKMFGGIYTPSATYYQILNEHDARFKQTFDSILYTPVNAKEKSLVWKKLWKSSKDTPMYYMRLAQMYLIRAEALIYMGASAKEIIDELNILRLRSGNTELLVDDYPTRDCLLDIVFNEYVREIGMENGSEYFVAVRMKKTGGIRKIQEYNLNFEKDIQLNMPIPEEELQYNLLMKQSPIYSK